MSMALQHPAALCLHGGMASSPTSSTATATSSGTLVASPHSNPEVGPSSAFQHQQQMGVASMLPGSGTASYCTSREWLYRLVTFPSYFTPCVSCCGGSRAPKREQLMTQFDTMYPYKVYCSHCPEVRTRTDGSLLQVRRSAFKDVVKATDILRFGCDVAGVQQYTLNGSKVIYLNREQTPERKGNGASTAPAFCSGAPGSCLFKAYDFAMILLPFLSGLCLAAACARSILPSAYFVGTCPSGRCVAASPGCWLPCTIAPLLHTAVQSADHRQPNCWIDCVPPDRAPCNKAACWCCTSPCCSVRSRHDGQKQPVLLCQVQDAGRGRRLQPVAGCAGP